MAADFKGRKGLLPRPAVGGPKPPLPPAIGKNAASAVAEDLEPAGRPEAIEPVARTGPRPRMNRGPSSSRAPVASVAHAQAISPTRAPGPLAVVAGASIRSVVAAPAASPFAPELGLPAPPPSSGPRASVPAPCDTLRMLPTPQRDFETSSAPPAYGGAATPFAPPAYGGAATPDGFVTPGSSAEFPGQPRSLSYDFSAWVNTDVPPPSPSARPLSYHVYSPKDLQGVPLRNPSRYDELPPVVRRKSVVTRLALMLVGALVVGATGYVVMWGSTDEEPAAARAAAPSPSPSPSPVGAVEAPLSISAPVQAPASLSPTPESAKPSATAPAKVAPSTVRSRASGHRAAGSSPTGDARSALVPPPNPYGGTPSDVLRPPPNYKK